MSSNGGVSNNNIIGNSSQSRIKVNLSQNEDDTLGATVGMEEEPHAIQPTLHGGDSQQQRQVTQPFQSDGSTPHHAPMQEMKQMEVQFNNPAQQAALLAEQ